MIAQAPLSSYSKTSQVRRSRPGQSESEVNHKFMQTVGDEMFKELEKIANGKGIGVQTLLRAVIIQIGSRPGQSESEVNHKFMQTVGDEMFKELEKIANGKGIGVQTLLRAVII